MSKDECRNRLQLQNQSLLYNDVRLIIPNTNTMIVNSDWHFLFGHDSTGLQFNHQRILIHFFQIARPEMRMHSHGRPYHSITQLLSIHL